MADRCTVARQPTRYRVFLVAASAPENYQIAQAAGGSGQITIQGTADRAGLTLRVGLDGNTTQSIGKSGSGGSFSGSLTIADGDQGRVDVYCVERDSTVPIAFHVGAGVAIGTGGQSNIHDFAPDQTANHATLHGGLYDADTEAWGPLTIGSYLPILGTLIMAAAGVPVAFGKAAVPGSSIQAWQKGAAEGYYDRLLAVLTAFGDAAFPLVPFHQGEADYQMSRQDYYDYLVAFGTNVHADTGLYIMPCKLQTCLNIDVSTVNLAIGDGWAHELIVPGPDLSFIELNGVDDDGIHLKDYSTQLEPAAQAWLAALQAQGYFT